MDNIQILVTYTNRFLSQKCVPDLGGGLWVQQVAQFFVVDLNVLDSEVVAHALLASLHLLEDGFDDLKHHDQKYLSGSRQQTPRWW